MKERTKTSTDNSLIEKSSTPLKAIRQHCLDCCCGLASEVKLCTIPDCALYNFRLGHNPNRKGIGNKACFKSNSESEK